MLKFKIADDAIAQEKIPHKTLPSGDKIPAMGMGTFGSDSVSASEVAHAVLEAISVGYRFIDCASVYGNEDVIGHIFQSVLKNGISREELFVNSKVWNNQHHNVIASCKKSLKDLQLDYLDMYMVHWPFPNYHAPGCDGDARNPDSKPYSLEHFMMVWEQMEQLKKEGIVRNIATSNMTVTKLKPFLAVANIKPVANEMECHPHFQQEELYQYLVQNNVQPIGFSPIGSPARPERDKTAEDTVDIEDEVIVKIAQRLNIHPAVVCIKWAYQRGQIPIPFSTKRRNIYSNLESLTKDYLTKEEMKEMAKIDKNCRLIKGQVFLWEGAKGWEDLWD